MLGVDIIEISRIRKSITGEAFIKKVFTTKEVEYCEGTTNSAVSASRFAVRFAAKEAVFKALPELSFLNWQEIEITNDFSGKPHVAFSGKSLEIIKSSGKKMEVSLSHSKYYAIAIVMVC